MKQSTIIFSSLLAAAAMSTVPAWASDITVENKRQELTTSNDNTYTTTNGQIFLNSWASSHTPTTFNCNVVLNGEGYKNPSTLKNEAKAALRLNENSTLAGTVTIGGNTRIWSSASSGTNTISGKISTKTDASEGSLTIVGKTSDFTGSVGALNLSGGMELTKGALKFEGTSASLTLSGTDKTYSAKSLTNTSVSSDLPTLTINTGVTLTLSNDAATAGADQTFSGSLSGAGTLKIAGGVQKLSGVYSGETSISVTSGGTLELAGNNAFVSGKVTVESGSKLKASVTGAGAVPLNAFSGVTFSDNAKLVLDLSGAKVDSGVALTIISASAISYAGNSLTQGKILSLVDVGNSNFGEYSSWTKEWTLETNTIGSTNTQLLKLTLTNVPEPSAFGLLAGIGALVFVAARRRRRKA